MIGCAQGGHFPNWTAQLEWLCRDTLARWAVSLSSLKYPRCWPGPRPGLELLHRPPGAASGGLWQVPAEFQSFCFHYGYRRRLMKLEGFTVV